MLIIELGDRRAVGGGGCRGGGWWQWWLVASCWIGGVWQMAILHQQNQLPVVGLLLGGGAVAVLGGDV